MRLFPRNSSAAKCHGCSASTRALRWWKIRCANIAIELAALGVEVTSELAQRVTEEVKRLREERAAGSRSSETIDAYEEAMRRLSIGEAEVAEIAVALGSPKERAIAG